MSAPSLWPAIRESDCSSTTTRMASMFYAECLLQVINAKVDFDLNITDKGIETAGVRVDGDLGIVLNAEAASEQNFSANLHKTDLRTHRFFDSSRTEWACRSSILYYFRKLFKTRNWFQCENFEAIRGGRSIPSVADFGRE